jgi:hypothetical protein
MVTPNTSIITSRIWKMSVEMFKVIRGNKCELKYIWWWRRKNVTNIYITTEAGAEPETIDRGCPVQINKIFRSKEILFFTIRSLFFSEPRGCPGTGRRLPWIRPCTEVIKIYKSTKKKLEKYKERCEWSNMPSIYGVYWKLDTKEDINNVYKMTKPWKKKTRL